jgi:hypothetical protein
MSSNRAAATKREYGPDVGKPRIERCGNHWNIEWFVGYRFYSLCYKTWAECARRAQKVADIHLREAQS